ncbi:cytochrome-c peroxidase [Beijerinckia sp. L45]|uniref:cytochrome-c peroxidase n=1 Tax=Beijerinckia sp. L45 TaxID=1641855 RepID=UPI00131D42A9|nr:cytochrome c peroxidase [Beijerinckia sp. L45]
MAVFVCGRGLAEAFVPDFPSQLSSDVEPITPIPSAPPVNPAKLELGYRLFEDPRLSASGTRSCLSCHDTRTNGASGRRFDTALDGSLLALNTNTVFNAALSFRQNWEGDARTLEAQAEAALQSPRFMGADLNSVVQTLSKDPDLVRLFQQVYDGAPDRSRLVDAIGAYERSLLTPGCRFDAWLGGDRAALSSEELDGYQTFKSLGCISCHQGVNVGGNLFERNDVFHPLAAQQPAVLRVPSLRNIATTPPYFHDGSAATLDDAVRRMGAAQLNVDLSVHQITVIVAFLKTLTGSYEGHPVKGSTP